MTTKVEQIKIESKNLRGTLAESILNPITGSLAEDDQTLIKFHGTYQQDDRDRREERAEKKLEQLYSFMIRLRIAGGKVDAKQWLGINEIADANSTAIIKITTRQTVQLHGVIKSKLKPTISWFNKYNLDSIAACGDVNRNVMSSVVIAKDKAYDEVYQYSQRLSDDFLPKTNAYNEIWLDGDKISPEIEEETLYGKTYLPRKFKIVIAIPPDNDVDLYAHDIGLVAIIENKKLLGFNISVGGGMGSTHGNESTYPRLGNIIGYAPKEQILNICEKIITIQRDFGNREERKLSRFKYTVANLGVDFIAQEIEKRSGIKLEKSKDFTFTKRGDAYGWNQDYKGNYHFLLFVENGRILDNENSKLKSTLVEIAKKEYANFRFTNNQNIIISDILPKNKKAVEEILTSAKISNNAISNLRSNSMACVALNTCPLALAEGQRYLPDLITKIEPLITKYKIENSNISLRMTGCPNGCARPFLAEIGLVGKSMGKYNLYLGASPVGERLNTLYKESLGEEEILNELDSLFELYVKNKKSDEAFGDFSNRCVL